VTARYLRGLGDTNILIYLERLAVDQLPAELLTSTVSLAELSAGVHSAVDAGERARRILRLQRVEATFSPLPFDVEAARQYGIIAAEVIAMGRRGAGESGLGIPQGARRAMPARSPHQRGDRAADLARPAVQTGPAENGHILAGVPCCRGVPGHPSKHGANMGMHRSRPPKV